jgi:predicted SAM-dependent methyltransferase
MKTFYYTVAIGDKFIHLANILKKSANIVGMDVYIFTPEHDDKNIIKNSRLAKIHGFFEIPLGYDRACFIDADCIILNNFENICFNGALIEDWGHRKRKYYPPHVNDDKKYEIWNKLNSMLDNMNMTEMRMDEIGKQYAIDNNLEYFGNYEWNGGMICGSIQFMTELMNAWLKWHSIIDDINENIFIRDQISFKYAYYEIGIKKWGFKTIPKELNWLTKKWGINKNAYILHEAGFVKKNKPQWCDLLNKLGINSEVIKLHFCCGKNKFDGWDNYDIDVDITKPLLFENDYADFIYCEHGLEHVEIYDGINFIKECYRILKPGGVMRLAVPCVDILFKSYDLDYECAANKDKRWLRKMGWSSIDKEKAIVQIMFGFKHKSVYTVKLLKEIMTICGFNSECKNINDSDYTVLKNIEGTGRGQNYHKFLCQTGVVEGIKC